MNKNLRLPYLSCLSLLFAGEIAHLFGMFDFVTYKVYHLLQCVLESLIESLNFKEVSKLNIFAP